MATSCRPWWRNCALEADSDILGIDSMEDSIAPIGPDVSRVRELISGLELCHHKADRWVHNIIEAIGAGETSKGLGTRSPGQRHPTEQVWQNACESLSAWCAGCPSSKVELSVGTVPASRILGCIGDRSPLKEWQVQRVVEKIRSGIHWSQSLEDPTARYVWILLNEDDYDVCYRNRCPDHYDEHHDFWERTVRTFIHDTENDEEASISLGLAIDMLMPCHWRFVENLEVVLGAIGGKLKPETPFAACGRNIGLLPNRRRMEVVCDTLNAFWQDAASNEEVDGELLELLGKRTEVKQWLAASLEKTMRLQLNPPPDLREMAALAGPDWIRQ